MEAGIDRKRGAQDIFTNKYELEYFPAPGGGKKPFALICPGGGYRFVMSCIEGEPYARALNEKGYTAFVLRYRTRKKGRFPAPQQDIARGVREILENAEKYEVQKEGYSVWGSSAGGHLAAGFGTKEYGYLHFGLPKPGVLILCYPVITMGKQTHPGSADNLLGKKAPAEEMGKASAWPILCGCFLFCHACGHCGRGIQCHGAALHLLVNRGKLRFFHCLVAIQRVA